LSLFWAFSVLEVLVLKMKMLLVMTIPD